MFDQTIRKLQQLSKDGIESYAYMKGITELINREGTGLKEDLLAILDSYCETAEPPEITYETAFSAMYALAYYYKRYDKTADLKKIIDQYLGYFPFSILRKEIESWYCRRTGDLERALRLDREMIAELPIETNAGPYISFASSVGKMLEHEYALSICDRRQDYWDTDRQLQDDWKAAVRAVTGAIRQYQQICPNQHYGKHFAIYGKLLAYTPGLCHKPLAEIYEVLDQANQQFELAISYENENEEDYFKRYEEYRQLQNNIRLLRIQYAAQHDQSEVNKRLQELNHTKAELEKELEQRKVREIELLTIFTAMISIIISGVSMSTKLAVKDGMLLLMAMACVCTFLVTASVLLTASKNKARAAVLLMLLAVLLLGALGWLLYTGALA